VAAGIAPAPVLSNRENPVLNARSVMSVHHAKTAQLDSTAKSVHSATTIMITPNGTIAVFEMTALKERTATTAVPRSAKMTVRVAISVMAQRPRSSNANRVAILQTSHASNNALRLLHANRMKTGTNHKRP
jgi:hypothetical protein